MVSICTRRFEGIQRRSRRGERLHAGLDDLHRAFGQFHQHTDRSLLSLDRHTALDPKHKQETQEQGSKVRAFHSGYQNGNKRRRLQWIGVQSNRILTEGSSLVPLLVHGRIHCDDDRQSPCRYRFSSLSPELTEQSKPLGDG